MFKCRKCCSYNQNYNCTAKGENRCAFAEYYDEQSEAAQKNLKYEVDYFGYTLKISKR